MTLSAGTRLGPYEIVSALGAGGMGEVYRARDSRLQRDVAIKVLPPHFAADPDRLARFTREAQSLAALNHPNIAQIHGLEESGELRALVMELVEGEDLADRIARGAPLRHAARRGAADRPPDRRRARGGARERHRPSRLEAGERPRAPRRHRQGARLRPRQGARSGRHERPAQRLADRPVADPHPPGDPARRHPRQRRLHGARAGARPRRRPPRRHLGVRRRAVRDAHRQARLRGRGGHGRPRLGAEERARFRRAAGGDDARPAAAPAPLPREGSEASAWARSTTRASSSTRAISASRARARPASRPIAPPPGRAGSRVRLSSPPSPRPPSSPR